MQCTPALRYCFCINILHTLCLAVNACYPLSFVVVVVCYPIAEEAINKSVNVMKSKGKSTEAPIDGISDCQGNKHGLSLLNSCFGLVRPRAIAQLTLFEAGLFFSFFCFFFFFFFFGKPLEAAAPNNNCGSSIRGQAKQSFHCSAQMCSACLLS